MKSVYTFQSIQPYVVLATVFILVRYSWSNLTCIMLLYLSKSRTCWVTVGRIMIQL